MEHQLFVERALKHLPSRPPTSFSFSNWSHAGRVTKEGFGIMPIAGVDPAKIIDAVMDVDHYVGNLAHVAECRSITDSRFEAPDHVRFYQKVNIPMLGSIHHELVLHRLGTHNGYEVAAWDILSAETDALSSKNGFRSDYNNGAWFVAPGILGYALGSAPRRKDVGMLKWKALTRGADVAASRVLKTNLDAMAKWARRR